MYEKVKALVLAHSEANAHMSFFVEDENYQAVLDMGEDAVPHLFRLVQDHPHFCFATIRALVPMPEHIRNKIMHIRGQVQKIADIYLEWGQEYERS